MDILQLIGKNFFTMPIQNNKKISTRYLLEEIFREYLDLIMKLDKRYIDIYPIIKNLAEGILECKDKYLNGTMGQAYNVLSKKLEGEVKDAIIEVSNYYNQYRLVDYYRARMDKVILVKRKEMFHIPFEERYKVGNQRYSISGFPCLYLGATPYTCWEELGRSGEGEKKIYFSRVKVPNKIRLVTIGLHPYELRDNMYREVRNENQKSGTSEEEDYGYVVNKYEKLLKSYLIMMPLIMACSIKVPEDRRDAVFKEEYIIPQILTQWVREGKDFEGIQYFSTVVKTYSKKNYKLYQNIVIPVKQNMKDGYCPQLKNILTLTEPICHDKGELLKEYSDIGFEQELTQNIGRIFKDDNSEIHYRTSGFHIIEERLLRLEDEKII